MTSQLTPTEHTVAALYADGASFNEIADQLTRSPHTVRSHLKNIYRKLGVRSKIELRKHLVVPANDETRPPVDLCHLQEQWALYRSAIACARTCTHESQIEAAKSFKHLYDSYPDFFGTHAGLSFLAGGAAFAASNHAEASRLLAEAQTFAETSLSLNAFHVDPHLSMGRALIFGGDLAAGEKHIRFALECDPGSDWAQYMLVFVLTHKGEAEEAIRFGTKFSKTITDGDVLEPMSLALACAHLQNKEWAQASAWAWSIINRNRAHGMLTLTACAILSELNRFSDLEAFAKTNRIEFCDPTPVQQKVHSRNGATLDMVAKHRRRLKSMFSSTQACA